ncbi:MAG: class A beta-lactamase-related serine hydrolase [Acidobacteria bacterium]|nr:MAG: class A beta-lactamase-related serine hydrolase [Acidobacteriota bacterium]
MDARPPVSSSSTPVDALLAERARAGDWPGASWAAGRIGASAPTFGGAVGRLSVEPRDEPARVDGLYDAASLTKPLALGAVVLALAAEGRLDPDEPLDAELPEFERAPGGPPSLADLLAHRAGLPAWFPLYRETEDPERVPELIARLAAGGSPDEPVYSCLGPIAAGIALERRFGVPLATLVVREVLEPLGLDSGEACCGPVTGGDIARVAPTERGRVREAELAARERPDSPLGRRFVPGPDVVLRGKVHDGNAALLGGSAGNAGLFITARAAFTVASALAAGARPFDRLAAELVRTPCVRGGNESRTFAFQSGEAPSAPAGPFGPRSFGHTGFTGTSVWISPEHDVVAVLLTNRVHPRWREAPMQDRRRAFHGAVLELMREAPS